MDLEYLTEGHLFFGYWSQWLRSIEKLLGESPLCFERLDGEGLAKVLALLDDFLLEVEQSFVNKLSGAGPSLLLNCL